jgi:OmcA/MtrC family decaheme c-type cytochrome
MKNRFLRYGGAALLALFIAGCGGDDGKDGAPGKDADPAITDQLQQDVVDLQNQIDALAQQGFKPESCAMCHTGTQPLAATGSMHQAAYDELYQDGKMVIVPGSIVLTTNGVDTTTLAFRMQLNGLPFDCRKLTTSESATSDFRIGSYWASYKAATVVPASPASFPDNLALAPVTPEQEAYAKQQNPASTTTANGTRTYDAGTGVCTLTTTQTSAGNKAKVVAIQTALTGGGNGIAQIYGTDQIQQTVGGIYQGKYPFGAVLTVGTVDYVSPANVSGCENCHTQPFLKHGERYGAVPVAAGGKGLEFVLCKGCHYDTRNGGHRDWQILHDDTARYAELQEPGATQTPEEIAKYTYVANVMNDTHMAHSMEFGYPQSIRNCVTCHATKLGIVLADNKFKAETCISCHSLDADPKAARAAPETIANRATRAYYGAHPAPGLITMMEAVKLQDGTLLHANYLTDLDTLKATPCSDCHKAGGIGPTFSALHNGGYEPMIFAADGKKYSDTVTASVDSAALEANNLLRIKFSATSAIAGLNASDITPTILIGLYGYDSKDFIVAAHGYDSDDTATRKRNLEYVWDSTSGTNPTNRFTQVGKTTAGATTTWELTADLSLWAGMLADGSVKRAEIAVLPELKSTFRGDGFTVALNAPSKTFNFKDNAFESYFKDIVQVAAGTRADGTTTGCNTCHVQVPSVPEFHSGIRGGNIKVCRICHEVSSAGSHLEMQSRSIDSYLHAIHSFQPFDPGDVNFDDPFARVEYEHHVNSQFPRFGTDCESCHKPGTYDVPDQSKSMPSLMSGIDNCATGTTPVPNCAAANRNIAPGAYGQWVTGPAVRACGACHRAETLTAEDGAGDPGALSALMGHWAANGYIVYVTDSASDLWKAVVKYVME